MLLKINDFMKYMFSAASFDRWALSFLQLTMQAIWLSRGDPRDLTQGLQPAAALVDFCAAAGMRRKRSTILVP